MAFLIPHAPGLWFMGVRCLISHVAFLIPCAPGWPFHSSCTKAAVNRGEMMWSHTSGGYWGAVDMDENGGEQGG